jgi:hypothetical protein
MSNDQHLTEKQVEREYHPVFRVKTLQAWRQLRKGPRFVKIGRRIFYPRTEIERFISENVIDTDSGRAS